MVTTTPDSLMNAVAATRAAKTAVPLTVIEGEFIARKTIRRSAAGPARRDFGRAFGSPLGDTGSLWSDSAPMPVNGGIRAAGRLSVFAMLLFASCGSEAPVGPSPVSGPPNVTGQWIGTLVETKGDRRTFELTMTLSQVPGGSRVTGNIVTVLRSARFTETIILGTFDGSTIDLTANSDEFPTTYVYQGTLVDNGRSLLGTSHVVNNAACCSWTARR